MAQAQLQTLVRNPPPRMLTTTETLHSMNHWKTSFRTYYRRDSIFKGFLLPEVRWNSAVANYNLNADDNGLAGAERRTNQTKHFGSAGPRMRTQTNCHSLASLLSVDTQLFSDIHSHIFMLQIFLVLKIK